MNKHTTVENASELRSLMEQTAHVADGALKSPENVAYTAGATGLVIALAEWIAKNSDQPVLEARTYGSDFEMLVAAMSGRKRARDVGA